MTPGAANVRDWQYMTGREIDAVDRSTAVVIVACSPLEVHGPHLPVITDNLEAQGIADRAIELMAERHPEAVFLRLPPIYVAADVLPHVGSVMFRSSTITRVLEDLGRSLAVQGFKNIWVSSFHGGPRHFVPIEVACDRVNRRYGARMVSLFSLLINRLTGGSSDLSTILGHLDGVSKEDLVGDTHGGAVETSLMLHLLGQHVAGGYQDLPQRTVDGRLRERGEPALVKGSRPTLPELMRGFKVKLRYFEEETYSGHPAVASAELGEAFLDTLAGHAVDALSELWTGQLSLERCHSPLWKIRHIFTNPAVSWLFERAVGHRSRVF
ncbi:MAG: creatininase family protein [Deltaproteobacteria bacterium]|nr:creatininase family protein [Deltaproteobacteria bacterium]MCB9788278.1 creatininase family protein [Deltaproteobacteria bacterium]